MESSPASAAAPSAPPRWPLLQRLLFRFVFVYFLAYNFPFPLNQVPWDRLPEAIGKPAGEFIATRIAGPWQEFQQKAVAWAGLEFFDRKIEVLPNGSGDTTWNYVHLLLLSASALIVALLWTILDHWSRDHRRLHDLWRTYCRFVLGAALISYGCFKVIPSQMPAPDLARLTEPLGEMSPMGLLWTFLGASKGYEIFSGAAELLAGWLLVTRHTTTLGALLGAAVMGNVVALNFFYDTPVKLYSSHLFLLALLLALPDVPRLLRVFVLQRAAPAGDVGSLFPRRGAGRVANAACLLLGLAFFGNVTWQTLGVSRKQYAQFAAPADFPLRGIWVPTRFELDGAPPVGDEDAVWLRLVLGSTYQLSLETVGDPYQRYFPQLDMVGKTMSWTKRGAPDWKATFHFDHPSPDQLTLDGRIDGHDIYAELRRIKTPEYLLVNRGFHWINEFPNNQ